MQNDGVDLSALAKRAAAILSAIAVIAVALAGILGAFSGGGQHQPPVVTSQSRDGKTITVPKAAYQQVQRSQAGDHDSLRDEQPDVPGVQSQPAPRTIERDNQANPRAPPISGPVPLAAPHQAGCITRSNSANFAYRNTVHPSLIVLHLTVARNLPGWADINGVWAFLNRPATQASANYIVDNEGHCILAISEALKSWSVAGFNSATACAIETQNTGNEASYVGSPGGAGERQLARVVHDCAARWHIPLRRAAVKGCSVVRSGVIDHLHLGSCGGGHNDIHNFGSTCRNQGPSSNTWACDDRIIAAARAGSKPPPTAHANALCRELMHYRREMAAKPPTFPTSRRARYSAVRNALVKARYRCSASGRAIRK